MGKIVGAFVLPHPPIMVKEVGKNQTQKVQDTINAAEEIAERIKHMKPDTVIVITPHGPLFRDAISISAEQQLKGNLGNFGAHNVNLEYKNDLDIVYEILTTASEMNIPCVSLSEDIRKNYNIKPELDHGALVPLYFIEHKYKEFQLIHITYGLIPHQEQYKFGMVLRKAIEASNKNVAIIASGDLSHKLTPDAPAGYDKRGREFDEIFCQCLKEGNVTKLLSIDHSFLEGAGECAYRSAIILFGALDGSDIKGEVLSYEGPFGVGYCVAQLFFTDNGKGVQSESKILSKYLEQKRNDISKRRNNEDAYVFLARATLEAYVRTGKTISVPDKLPIEMLNSKAGVFVSIKKDGELRGCIGTTTSTRKNIAEEIINNAISAGTKDPRFYPVEADELDDLIYSVDVLMEAEDISDKNALDVEKYGVIVRNGHKAGLLLPNLEGVDTVDKQIEIVLKKAGISRNEKYSMQRFEVVRHY